MRSLIICESSFSQRTAEANRLIEYQNALCSMGEAMVMTSLSQVERCKQLAEFDVVIVMCDELSPHMTGFILRIFEAAPQAMIVNASHWQQTQLERLLCCGRITFVPEKMAANRITSLVNLAQARFDAANKSIAEFKKLDDEIKGLKLLSQAKLIVMQQGFTEEKAHKIIQQQAMQKGITMAQMSAQIIAVMSTNSPAESCSTKGMLDNGAHQIGAKPSTLSLYR
ncbi:ANTAR domain-containing response regulator [Shewanella gaetbuli]|uniref:ANTAR domain-containing protein n=1 Tax=Shewanella gaetbuli TaxID=220752 RepID=A0A9X1ZRK0_9GAMM|nr:ANTAR domain-containing protein [Shewanella gaetbuli]MCL1144307.1 ANTAR domain-containing protein [Shewanella gaetbuli]